MGDRMNSFYNGNKLLSLKDAGGREPELYFCCGNRTAGKTFFFKRWMLRRFVKYGEKFVIFVRFIDDISNTASGFFADVGAIEFPGHEFGQRPIIHGKAAELLFDKRPCGFVIALNDPERIKRNSALFADAERGFLDEFMSETGKYVPRELEKFNAIRISIARGGTRGVHARRFPVYLCSNNVTVFNPYFEYLGIAPKLQNRTKFLRGDGWVLEQTFNQQASAAIQENFHTILGKEIEYAAKNEYLLDTNTFVFKVPDDKTCAAVIKFHGKRYGIWGSQRFGRWYVSRKAGDSRVVIAVEHDDHDEGTTLVSKSNPFMKTMRSNYMMGNVRFDSQASKNAFLSAMQFQ